MLDSTDASTRAGEDADVAHTLISCAEKFWGNQVLVVGDLPNWQGHVFSALPLCRQQALPTGLQLSFVP